MAKGLFREGAFAQVDYDGSASYPIAREHYELKGYEPPFDDLPTSEDYWKGRSRFGEVRGSAG